MLKTLILNILSWLSPEQFPPCGSRFGVYHCCLPRGHSGRHAGHVPKWTSWRTEDEG